MKDILQSGTPDVGGQRSGMHNEESGSHGSADGILIMQGVGLRYSSFYILSSEKGIDCIIIIIIIPLIF